MKQPVILQEGRYGLVEIRSAIEMPDYWKPGPLASDESLVNVIRDLVGSTDARDRFERIAGGQKSEVWVCPKHGSFRPIRRGGCYCAGLFSAAWPPMPVAEFRRRVQRLFDFADATDREKAEPPR